MLSDFFIQGMKHFVVATGKRPLEWKANLAEIGSFALFQINDTSNELYFFFCVSQSLQNAFSSDVLVLVEQHGRSEKETVIGPNKRKKKIFSIFLFLCCLPIPNTKLVRPGVTSVGTYYTREKLLIPPPWDRETRDWRDWTVCCYYIVKVGQHYRWLTNMFIWCEQARRISRYSSPICSSGIAEKGRSRFWISDRVYLFSKYPQTASQ